MPPLILAAIPFLKALPRRAIGIAVVAAGLFIGGWTVNGWRWSGRWAEHEAAIADARTKASEEAREREQVLADAIAMIDAEHTAERTKADAENARLRADVAAGAVRLHGRRASATATAGCASTPGCCRACARSGAWP